MFSEVNDLKRNVNILAVLSLVVLAFLLSACGSSKNQQQESKTEKTLTKDDNVHLNIVTTDKMLCSMVKDIVKDRHNAEFMFKGREDELYFKFSDDSISNISNQDLFIYFGSGFEPWINNFIDKLNKSKVGAINASRGIKLLSLSSEKKYNDITIKENPYYYLNIDNYKIALINVKNAVEDKDAKNREFYEKNYSEAVKNLDGLEKEYKELGTYAKDTLFITTEDDFDYFVKYSSLKSYKMINSSKEETQKLEEAMKPYNTRVFLYGNDEELKKNENLIKNYNLKPLKIRAYDENMGYVDLMKNNMQVIKTLYGH